MLSGKRALVTGSGSGIGLAVARCFLAHGAKVVLTSERSLVDLPAVAELIDDYPLRAVYVSGNLLRPDTPERIVRESSEVWGGLDILVNNAGTFDEPPLLELRRSHFDRTFHLNVWAALATTQAWVRRAERGGRILFTTSLNATRSETGHTLYDASKAALEALVRQLALELAPRGFTTAAVAPGLVATPLTSPTWDNNPAVREDLESRIPLGRIAEVADLAEWYAFLASDAACYATGVVIPIDGGLNAQQMSQRERPATTTDSVGGE